MVRAARSAAKSPKASFLLLLVLCSAFLAAGRAPAQTGEITYIYDELGRLVGVVDPSGEAAVYTYDAVGNLLSISRRSSSNVSIIEFTPDGGAVGSTVTIYGTGFSATPGQNAVTFNGVAASVTSATSMTLVTSVPSGATTGPISVTTPAGSATSGAPFQVAGSSAPTITDFSPLVGTAGSTLTVNGTNFETVPSNNKAKVNVTGASVTSASASSLALKVGLNTGSGRVSVETPGGKAVGGDFFVPPAPYTAADVVFTGRMSVGESRAVTVGTASKVGLVVFDGTAGQRVSLTLTGNTFGNGVVTIYNPDGTTLNSGGASGGFVDVSKLPRTGTYTILVDPSSTNTGSATLTLYNVSDVTGTITPGGASMATQVTTPGQNVSLTFAGTAGQRVSLKVTGITYGYISSSNVYVYVRDPGGASLGLADINGSASEDFIDAITLPVTGTYSITLNPPGARTGNATFTLYDVPPDASAHIVPGAPNTPVTATVTTTVPGQNFRVTFDGTAGQKITLMAAASGMSLPSTTLYNPDGTMQSGAREALVLPATGTYTVTADPTGTKLGSMTFTLYVVADITGTIAIDGPAVTTNITVPGQQAFLTFSGTAGQRVSLNMTNCSFPFYTYGETWAVVRKPDGTTLAYMEIDGQSSRFLDVFTLPVTGTYSLRVDPYQTSTGSAAFRLYNVADVTGTITVGGPSVTKTTTVPGQNVLLAFEGSAGQKISLRTTGLTGASILNPDGTTLAEGSTAAALTLPVTGTYTVFVNPGSSTTGSVTVTLYNVVDITGTITPGGGSVTANLSTPGQRATYTFEGTVGQRVSLNITGSSFSVLTYSDLNVYIRRPDGTAIAYGAIDGVNTRFIEPVTLPTTGTYTIDLDPPDMMTGSATFTLYDVPADVSGSIGVGGAAVPVTITTPGQNAALAFAGLAGQQVTVRLTGNTAGTVAVKLLRPDGTVLTSLSSSASAFNLTTQTLAADGTYQVVIDPSGARTGGISVSLTNP